MPVETTREYVICNCGHNDHMFILIKDKCSDNYVDVALSVHLSPIPLFKRIKHAFFYILGKRSRYGDFDEVLLNRESVSRIQSFLDEAMKDEYFK